MFSWKKVKKALVFILCLCMLESLFIGFTFAEETLDTMEKYEDGLTISIVRNSSNAVFDESRDGYKSWEDNVWTRAYADRLGITLNTLWMAPQDDYVTKWNASISSNNIPDVAVVPAEIYLQLLDAGYVEDMTDYYEEYASDAYREAVAMDAGSMTAITVDGRIYGLPFCGATAQDAYLLYIRKDWLDKLNLEVPTTLDELFEVARQFKDAQLGGPDTIGLAAHNLQPSGAGSLNAIFSAFGVFNEIWMEDENGELFYGLTSPKMKDALNALKDAYDEGLIPQDFAVWDDAKVREKMVSGQVGLTYGVYWTVNTVPNCYKADPEAEWIVVEGVRLDGSPYIDGVPLSYNNYLFVKKGIENPEAIVKMINLQFELVNEAPKVYDNVDGANIVSIYYAIAPGLKAPWNHRTNHRKIEHAILTGDESMILGTVTEPDYKIVKNILDGTDTTVDNIHILMKIGPGDSIYGIFDDMDAENRLYVNKFLGSYSEFALQNLTDLNTALLADCYKIIMGEKEVSAFDDAVKVWYDNGGEQITKEVNEWFATK